MSRRVIHLTFSLLLLYACVEPFEPEVAEYDSTLVVDALFSNSDSASIVRITRSIGLLETEPVFVENASVVIEDDQGGSTTLQQISPGIYVTDPKVYKGEVGKRYRLLIDAGGNRFESDWQLMKPSPPIGDIDFEVVQIVPDDPIVSPIQGVQLYLDTKDTENQTRFYRWEWVETYAYRNPDPPRIRVEFSGFGRDRTAEFFTIPPAEFEGFNCWKSGRSTEILIASTENLVEDQVMDFPLLFVDNKSPRLSLRYSILVRQYAISKDYYLFLEKVEQLNETTGSLFDPIPNEVFGNIQSGDGKDIPVLGYFGVGGATEKRIFIDRLDLGVPMAIPTGPPCVHDTVEVGDISGLYNAVETKGEILYDYHRVGFANTIVGYLLTEEHCAFCAANGATRVKPDFW